MPDAIADWRDMDAEWRRLRRIEAAARAVIETTADRSPDGHGLWQVAPGHGQEFVVTVSVLRAALADRLEGLRVKEGDPAARMPYFDPATLIAGTAPETTPAGVLDEAALLDAALTTAILAMAGIPCGEPHDSDLRYAFGPDGSFAADLRAALRGSGRE